MRVFWEKRARWAQFVVWLGFSDRDVAKKLNLTELSVQACIAWILQFPGFTNQNELIHCAAVPTQCECGTECER